MPISITLDIDRPTAEDLHSLQNLDRFTTLARRGRSSAASSGERVAHRIAQALHDIGDDIALLDYDALDGFLTLCQLASGPWSTDEQKQRIFATIARCAT
jgi:hypothetical protein